MNKSEKAKRYNGKRDKVVQGRFTEGERVRIKKVRKGLSFSDWVMQQVTKLEKEQANDE